MAVTSRGRPWSTSSIHADGSTGKPVEVRTEGSNGQVWGPNSRTLYIEDERHRLMKVTVGGGPDLEVSPPTQVYDFGKLEVAFWTVLPDGRFFVGLKSEDELEITRYNLVLGWTDMLKRKMRAAQ